MLEVAVILQRVRGRLVETGIIAGLLVFDAALGVLRKSRAQATLAALKSRLAMNTSIQRDGTWSIVPVADLVEQNQQTRHLPRLLGKQCLR
jgi:H+-transporting ATPase